MFRLLLSVLFGVKFRHHHGHGFLWLLLFGGGHGRHALPEHMEDVPPDDIPDLKGKSAAQVAAEYLAAKKPIPPAIAKLMAAERGTTYDRMFSDKKEFKSRE